MHKDRMKLEEILTALFITYNSNKNVYENMKNELKNKILPGKLSDIFDLRIQMRFISSQELCLITKAFYNQIKDERISPEEWFTEQEIQQVERTYLERGSNEQVKSLVLHNVDQIKCNQWVSSHESFKNISEYFNKGLITYNQNIQREGIKKVIAGQQIVLPKIIPTVVEDISRKMKEGSFTSNMITLNILSSNSGNILYDKQSRTLTVIKDDTTEVSIIDGSHRCFSIIKIMSELPEFEDYMVINILNYDVKKAQGYIYQEAQHTEIDPELLKTFNSEDRYMEVANEINSYGSKTNNMLFNRLGKTNEDVQKFDKYCLMSTFAIAIEDNFKEDAANPRNRRKLVTYLIEFFNELISIYYDDFINTQEAKKSKVILENNIFIGYVYIAKKLYNKENWHDELEKSLKFIDWNKNNKVWDEIRLFNGNLSKPTRKSIYNFFQNLLENEVEK